MCVFSQIKGTVLGVPTIRVTAFWGLSWGPPILGNYNVGVLGCEIHNRSTSQDRIAKGTPAIERERLFTACLS